MIFSNLSKPTLDRLLWFPLTGGGLTPSKIDNLKKTLTVKKKYSKEIVSLYQFDDDAIGIPIHHFNLSGRSNLNIDDNRVDGEPISIEFTSGYKPGQEEVVDKFNSLLASGYTGFTIKAPTGWGKTAVCIKFISLIKKTTLIIVPREDLVDQWERMFLEHSNLKPSEIGKASGGKVDWVGKKVVIGLVHTITLDRVKGNAYFIKEFGLIVFDEVDRSVPPATFSAVASLFPARYRIGVSAELERSDGMDVVFKKHVGQCTIQARGSTRMKPKVIVHYFNEDSGYVHMDSSKINRRGMLISKVANNNRRNYELCKYIKMIYDSGRQCLVVSDRVKQLQALNKLLCNDFNIPASESGFYVGSLTDKNDVKVKVTKQERKRVAENCSIILGTYGKVAIGTDIKSLAGLVIATPQSNIVQTLGRILREMEGKQTPVVVDFVDTYYSDATGWFYNRRRHYTSENIFVKEVGNFG